MADKRGGKRKIKRVELRYTINGVSSIGFSSNLSENGLFVHSNRPLPPGSEIEITAYLPSGKSFLRGRVVRSSCFLGRKVIGVPVPKNGMGVELAEKDELYEQFVSSLPD